MQQYWRGLYWMPRRGAMDVCNACALGNALKIPQGGQLQRPGWQGVKGELCSLCCIGV